MHAPCPQAETRECGKVVLKNENFVLDAWRQQAVALHLLRGQNPLPYPMPALCGHLSAMLLAPVGCTLQGPSASSPCAASNKHLPSHHSREDRIHGPMGNLHAWQRFACLLCHVLSTELLPNSRGQGQIPSGMRTALGIVCNHET